MSDADADQLQEAAADVAYLTSQGESPTDAIAKVASAARFPRQKTDLLTYAYSNGLAAEKRDSTGGPFERLAEFTLPDPVEIHRLVFGLQADPPSHDKTASVPDMTLPCGMATFDIDPTQMDRAEVRRVFGMEPKTASEDETDDNGKPVGRGFSMSHIRISIGLGSLSEDGDEPDLPKSLQDHLRSRIGGLDLSNELETTLLKMLGSKKEAMIQANADADDAFSKAQFLLDALGRKLGHRHLEPHFKRAGLVSVNAYYPQIAALLGPYLDEVNGFLVKDASHASLDVTANHPWVVEAGALQKELETVTERTITANEKSAEYEAVCRLYQNRDRIRKSASLTSFLVGTVTPGTAKSLLMKQDRSKEKDDIRREILDSLDNRLHDLSLQDIKIQSMLNDFGLNDGVLRAYGKKRLLEGYNSLLPTAPNTMRNPEPARSLLRQHMTYENAAPTDYMSAMKMNVLDPRKETFTKEKERNKKNVSDD